MLLIALMCVPLCTGTADAAVTVGNDLTPAADSSVPMCNAGYSNDCTWSPTLGVANNALTAPAGVVVRWRIKVGAVTADKMTFRTIHRPGPVGITQLGTAVNSSATVSPPPNTLSTYATRIPIAAGDYIGVDYVTSGSPPDIFPSTGGGSSDGWGPHLADGKPEYSTASGGGALLLQADVEPDPDGDGYGNETQDNCPGVANPDQADNDHDGQGDACDADDDNDGLSDSDEASRGTNPLVADSDGDGVPDGVEVARGMNPLSADGDGDGKADGVDGCPAVAGTAPDGCPQVPATPGLDRTPPKLVVAHLPKKIALRKFRRALAFELGANEAAAVDVELRGATRAVRLARAYDEVLAERSVELNGRRLRVVLKPRAAALRGAPRRFKVQLLITATDIGGNRTRVRRTIRVG